MAAALAAPRYSADRYSAEDFETVSIRSAAPSYVSEAPSYHSNLSHQEPVPPYTPRENHRTSCTGNNANQQDRERPRTSQQTTGLPPIPTATPLSVPSLHNFRIPTWSTRNAPAARQLHSVVERRVNAAGSSNLASASTSSLNSGRYQSTLDRTTQQTEDRVMRPLEDPYLVGERAAEQAKQERLARERGDDILLQEDKHWDWLLEQMKTWDERERSFARFRRDVDTSRRGRLLRRMGGRI